MLLVDLGLALMSSTVTVEYTNVRFCEIKLSGLQSSFVEIEFKLAS